MTQIRADNYNPDVLTCIANLSSDEVFTPPQLVNRMLDLLPAELWIDNKATFLDPGCKSGVFLREIAKRLDAGLETQIPGRQERMNHIFKSLVSKIIWGNPLFGKKEGSPRPPPRKTVMFSTIKATYGIAGDQSSKAGLVIQRPELDLVKQETERIDSRFIEPACGTGNFLADILERKARVATA